MRTGKLIRKAIPYLVVAVVIYLIFKAHLIEGFLSCPNGQVVSCPSSYILSSSNSTCYKCSTSLNSSKQCKDVSGGTFHLVTDTKPATCACPSGQTMKCPSNKSHYHDGACYANAGNKTGGAVSKRCLA